MMERSGSQDAFLRGEPKWLMLLVLGVIAYFPLFLHFDSMPLRLWDEIRLAWNAYEMMHNGEPFVTYFQGAPDMWNTKPPLLIWIEALSFSVLGPSEFSFRLPSVIAAFLTCYFLFRTTSNNMAAPWMGFIAVLLLVTTDGYLTIHAARSGNYEALLVLFMTLSVWSIYRWSNSDAPKDIFLFFVFLSLAALTKGIQALLFLPGIFLFVLFQRKLIVLLRQRQTYAGLAVFLVLVVGYYLLREHLNPGYLTAVWENELGGRYGAVLEGHQGKWDFYVRLLMDHHFANWWLLVPCGMVLGLAHRDPTVRRWSMLLTCIAATYLYVISSAQTKLEWYAVPLFPVLCGLAALAIYIPFLWLYDLPKYQVRTYAAPLLFLFLIFVRPYSTVVARAYFPKDLDWEVPYNVCTNYLQALWHGKTEVQPNVVCYDWGHDEVAFYVQLNKDAGTILDKKEKDDLLPGDRVFTVEHWINDHIEANYETETLYSEHDVRVYLIKGKRDGSS